MLYLTTGVLFNESELSQGDFFNLDQLPYNGAGTSTMSPGAYSDTAISLQLANPQILIIKFFQLTEWVYKVIVAQQKASKLTQENVLMTYTKCLDWYRDLFELIGDAGSRSPFILLTQSVFATSSTFAC
ncbi:Fungal transcriptional regulatory protein [Akanthomyces lecanii RCEF 1005]|uniref:Fungal transcriptional regulatory protein n=1 Tax=Akanthomyces lecanii RCEF 1005 TaxID=1081108 RepID=A0A167V049_CORDF|nr:Fungal transcriptional regulatory protein [Akanthomyces lecanii RCEF 1005]